ncbi:MAG: STAS domain-containing protein [Treponema sp.]|jgi:anti-sigma B factor antagonist|nr:STAS domain-containing protein [Treponema sp.]
MIIQSERLDRTSLVLFLSGRLDTATAPQFERKVKQVGDDITELTIDLLGLTYISSMGLRVLLQTQKALNESGRKLIIRNMNESIREVFEMTGFIKLIVQEEKFLIIKKEEGSTFTFSLIGQMDEANVPALQKELSVLKEIHGPLEDTVFVLLDLGKLESLSARARKPLKRVLEETAWPRRKLTTQNASETIRRAFKGEGMGDYLE